MSYIVIVENNKYKDFLLKPGIEMVKYTFLRRAVGVSCKPKVG